MDTTAIREQLKARDQLRAQDVQVMNELRQDIRDLRAFLQQTYQQQNHRGQL